MGTDNPFPIFFTKWTKRPRFFEDVSSSPKPPGPEPPGQEPPRTGAAAARPEIIVEPTSFASLALGMFCHTKVYQSY
jgi:hypothetical protein